MPEHLEDWEPEFTSDFVGAEFQQQYFDSCWRYAFGSAPLIGDLLKDAIGDVVASLEGFSDEKRNQLHESLAKYPCLWRWIADWWYSQEFVQAIPQIRDRFVKLDPVLCTRTQSPIVNGYLREATRCYIYGLDRASIALSRAALEQALKERLGAMPEATNRNLVTLIHMAEESRLLRPEFREYADTIRSIGNNVLHPGAQPYDAWGVLIKVRMVLREIFRGEAGPV